MLKEQGSSEAEVPFNLRVEAETAFRGLQDVLIATPEFKDAAAEFAVGLNKKMVEPPMIEFRRGEGDLMQSWTMQRYERLGLERLVVSVTSADGGWQVADVQVTAGRIDPRIEYKKGIPGSPPLVHEANTRSAVTGVNLLMARLQSPPVSVGM